MQFAVRAILDALEKSQVRYVVVGGFAVIMQGYFRATHDLDLVIDLDADNCLKALAALEAIGLRPRLPVPMSDFADPATRKKWADERNMLVFQLWDPANPTRSVDVFVREPIAFEQLWNEADDKELQGAHFKVASIRHLIQMKRDAGRLRDQDDIEKLLKLDALRRQGISHE